MKLEEVLPHLRAGGKVTIIEQGKNGRELTLETIISECYVSTIIEGTFKIIEESMEIKKNDYNY